MGTNFYWIGKPACDHCGRGPERGDHIGKRSAAGRYCWTCNVTLCMDGVDAIHCGRSGWYDTCPKCGDKPPSEESLRASAGGVELGFAKPATERKSGIASCASFSWAQSPAIVRAACETAIGEPAVVDEYGRALTGGEFLQMLRANCPIEFTGSIGQEFF